VRRDFATSLDPAQLINHRPHLANLRVTHH
jgi:hypothetical protein